MPLQRPIITVSLNPAIDRVIEVENFTLGRHQVGREVQRSPGGKGINVSRVLSALGIKSVATGFLGEDNIGSFEPFLSDPNVGNEFFVLPGRTRENITITDPRAGQDTHVRDAGLTVAPRHLDRLANKLRLLSHPEAIVIFSGSLPPGATPQDHAVLVDACLDPGARVAVDTGGEALAPLAGRNLWLIKPNAAELAEFVGCRLDDRRDQILAARNLTAHVAIVLLTCGEEGSYLFTKDHALHARVPLGQDEVRNTVGSGDVLLGAFVAAVWQGRPLPEALTEAVAAATASVCTVTSAEFDPKLAAQLRRRVELVEV